MTQNDKAAEKIIEIFDEMNLFARDGIAVLSAIMLYIFAKEGVPLKDVKDYFNFLEKRYEINFCNN